MQDSSSGWFSRSANWMRKAASSSSSRSRSSSGALGLDVNRELNPGTGRIGASIQTMNSVRLFKIASVVLVVCTATRGVPSISEP